MNFMRQIASRPFCFCRHNPGIFRSLFLARHDGASWQPYEASNCAVCGPLVVLGQYGNDMRELVVVFAHGLSLVAYCLWCLILNLIGRLVLEDGQRAISHIDLLLMVEEERGVEGSSFRKRHDAFSL